MAAAVAQPVASTSALTPFASMSDGPSTREAFEAFRAELDEHQDRRERLIKISRDCTAASKKLIFLLHRVTQQRNPAGIIKQAEAKNAEILALLQQAAPELANENMWRYARAISPGIEEWIEGLTFLRFLQVSSASNADSRSPVMPFDEIQQTLLDVGMPALAVIDYLGGLGDLTGELMRLGINRIGTSGGIEGGQAGVAECETCIRSIKQGIEPLVPHVPKLVKKMQELQRSLRKLEDASYTLALRGREYADYPDDIKAALMAAALADQRHDDAEE